MCPPPRLARSARFVGVLLAVGFAGLGCSPAVGGQEAERPVVPYSGPQAKLFDDALDPAAVGLDYDKGYSPRADKSLRERSQTGDAVIRVKVATVTAKTDGPDKVYQLGLHSVEKLTGKKPPPADFTVQITKASESLGIMKNFESRLVGYAFVAFVREFADAGGEHEIHFHLAPDTKDVKTAVGDAMLLGELK